MGRGRSENGQKNEKVSKIGVGLLGFGRLAAGIFHPYSVSWHFFRRSPALLADRCVSAQAATAFLEDAHLNTALVVCLLGIAIGICRKPFVAFGANRKSFQVLALIVANLLVLRGFRAPVPEFSYCPVCTAVVSEGDCRGGLQWRSWCGTAGWSNIIQNKGKQLWEEETENEVEVRRGAPTEAPAAAASLWPTWRRLWRGRWRPTAWPRSPTWKAWPNPQSWLRSRRRLLESSENRTIKRKESKKLEDALDDMRKMLQEATGRDPGAAPGQPPTAVHTNAWSPVAQPSRRTSFGRAPAVLDQQFVPSVLIVRGFAPFGCDPKQKIGEKKAKELQVELIAMLPNHMRANIEAQAPFQVNHQLLFRCSGQGNEPKQHCYSVAGVWNARFEAGWTIGGKPLKAVLELSPEKRLLCRNFYAAGDWLRSVVSEEHKEKVVACGRSLRIYSDTNEVVGETPRNSISWKWRCSELQRMGIDVTGIGNEHRLDPPEAAATQPLGDGDAEM